MIEITKTSGLVPARKGKKYPFKEMEIGDNFTCECTPEMIYTVRKRLIGSANSLMKHYGFDRKFSTRMSDNGVTIYRIK